MTPTAPPTSETLTGLVRERARAEAAELAAMQAYRDAEMARTASVEPPQRRFVERSAIPMSIGEVTGLSEGQVQYRLSTADTLCDQSPITWEAFREGRIDFVRAREIAHTIGQLRRADSLHRLDRLAVPYAVEHTVAELRQWLHRFVRRVEADLATERANSARDERRVSVRHGDDSMADLHARLTSHEAAAIAARLHKEARRPGDPDDDRTVAQKEADQLVAWCTDSEAASSALDADIAVTIGANVLAGAVSGFAESTDGQWAVPAGWLVDAALTGNAFWQRMVLDPVTDDVLSFEYKGRFCPATLKVALMFLHGVCQAPGCRVPAELCDQDHRVPFPDGPTSASNMGPLCRRHHGFKGHGVLRWSVQPPSRPGPTSFADVA